MKVDVLRRANGMSWLQLWPVKDIPNHIDYGKNYYGDLEILTKSNSVYGVGGIIIRPKLYDLYNKKVPDILHFLRKTAVEEEELRGALVTNLQYHSELDDVDFRSLIERVNRHTQII